MRYKTTYSIIVVKKNPYRIPQLKSDAIYTSRENAERDAEELMGLLGNDYLVYLEEVNECIDPDFFPFE